MKKIHQDYYKVAIIGAGKVGITAAYALLLEGIVHEIVLYGRDRSKLVGEQLDLEHAAALARGTKVTITDNFEDLKETDVFVFTAGAAQLPGETRLELAEKNLKIVDQLVPQLFKVAPEALLLMVTNPVDVLTYRASELLPHKRSQIFGSGTLLDTARFRFHLSELLKVNPESIHAYILGEHGDHSFPVLSNAMVGGQKLMSFPKFYPEDAQMVYQKARDCAYMIIESKGATYYGIGASITSIIKNIVRDSKKILPLSVRVDGYYDQREVAFSVPVVLGAKGVEQIIEIELDDQEQLKLIDGVKVIKQAQGIN